MELLRSWVNDELKLSRSVSSFEVDMANGYLIGEILVRHGLLPGHAPLEASQRTETLRHRNRNRARIMIVKHST